MDPFEASEIVLSQIKNSNLNFKIQESPFSIHVNIKKSFITSKNGDPLHFNRHFEDLSEAASQNKKLLKENENLKEALEANKTELEDLNTVVNELGIKLEKAKVELHEQMSKTKASEKAKLESDKKLSEKESEIASTKHKNSIIEAEKESLISEMKAASKTIKKQEKEIKNLKNTNKTLEEKFGERKNEISTLKVENHNYKQKIQLLTKKVSVSTKFTNTPSYCTPSSEPNTCKCTSNPPSNSTLECLPSTSITENKANQNISPSPPKSPSLPSTSLIQTCPPHHQLKSKSSSFLSTPSSSQPPLNLTPITSKGFCPRAAPPFPSKTSADAPSPCKHTPQCSVRQPLPPPVPSMIPLVNYHSLYHQKMQAGELDWGSTCSYCMRIEYERYGCDSCVWIKCFGELHGYPDVNPYDFKKYLEHKL